MTSDGFSADKFLAGWNAFCEQLKRAWPSIVELLKNFAVGYQQYELLKQAGWVPHATTPMDLIDQCNGDAQLLSASIEAFYQDNWQSARHELEDCVASYPIDAEAKTKFSEALAAHEAGFYRLVVSGLFPEIERVVRVELFDGAVGSIRASDGNSVRSVWKHLIESAGHKLSLSDFDSKGFSAVRLVEFLSEHMFEHVNTPQDQARFAADPVPNRHAVVHGLVEYRSAQNSLNMIFLADFLLRVIGLLKEQRSEHPLAAELHGDGSR